MIRLLDVSFSYCNGVSETKALNSISLQISRGEFVAVVGSNGSGKSTLAKHLNALLIPSAGNVIIDGHDTSQSENCWKIRQLVGMVFQNPDNQIIASMVEEDIAFGPENLGLTPDKIRQRVEMALAAVDLADQSTRPPHLLSGGQKQRVAIAGVLAMLPQVLVLDEPTSMLDSRGRDEVLKTVQELRKTQGLTVVYITHQMEEASVADRVLVMDSGRVIADGTPGHILTNPDLLTSIGLEIPEMAELARKLRRRGIPVGDHVITVPEMVDCLCQLL